MEQKMAELQDETDFMNFSDPSLQSQILMQPQLGNAPAHEPPRRYMLQTGAQNGHHLGTSSLLHKAQPQTQMQYYRKWKRLKKLIKNLVFVNAAVCDEVVHVDEKVARLREERRFLLRKVLQHQSVSDTSLTPVKPLLASSLSASKTLASSTSSLEQVEASISKAKPKKKVVSEREKKKITKELIESMRSKPKKVKAQSSVKKTVPLIPLDHQGRPVLPLVLGDLTIHSIGEVVTDRPTFHDSNSIYPEGFCSTRVYASTQNPEVKCLYTCKISDNGDRPLFEISPEDDSSQVWKSTSLSGCHTLLLKAINQSRGMDIIDVKGNGADFFGLAHPIMQNLIQSCPGARKCAGYKWVKFEINKLETVESLAIDDLDPTVSFTSLKKALQAPPPPVLLKDMKPPPHPSLDQTTSLRSLLTGGPYVSTGELTK